MSRSAKRANILQDWGASEERGDAHFYDLSELRIQKMLENEQLDTTMLALAVRQPFSEAAAYIEQGNLSLPMFRSMVGEITEKLTTRTQEIFEVYLERYTNDQSARSDLSGYLGEVSLHLLLLRAAHTRNIVVLPSKITDDAISKNSKHKVNPSFDAQVYTTTKDWTKVQIKSDQSDPGAYEARIIQPPELPVRYDPTLGLPINIFYDFLDMQEGTASKETIHTINAHAATLARSFE